MARYRKCYVARGVVGGIVGALIGGFAFASFAGAAMIAMCGFAFAGETALIKLDQENVVS